MDVVLHGLAVLLFLLGAGIVCGLLMTAPVGPMGTLALMKLAEGKPRDAKLVALGAVGADVTVAFIVSLGLGLLGTLADILLPEWLVDTGVVWAMAGVLLLVLAVKVVQWPANPKNGVEDDGRNWGLLSYMFTLGHPGNYASFAAAFAWLHSAVAYEHLGDTWLAALVPPVGVAIGGGAFWYGFLLAGRRLLRRISPQTMLRGLRWLLAVMLAGMALGALYYAWVG